MQADLPLPVIAISVHTRKTATPMSNESPDIRPSDLSPKQGGDAESNYSFRSPSWKSGEARLAKRTRLPPRPFTLEQSGALLYAAMRSTCPDRDVVLLGLLAEKGLHISELAELTWQDIHLEESVPFVQVFKRKGELPCIIPIPSKFRNALLRYKAAAALETPSLSSQEAIQQINVFGLARHEPLRHHQHDRSRNRRAICKLLTGLAQDSGIDLKDGSIALRLRATLIHRYLSLFPDNPAGLARLLGVSLQTAMRYQADHTVGTCTVGIVEMFNQLMKSAEPLDDFETDGTP